MLSWVTGTVYSDEALRRLFTLRFARRLEYAPRRRPAVAAIQLPLLPEETAATG